MRSIELTCLHPVEQLGPSFCGLITDLINHALQSRFLKEHTVEDEMNDVDGEEENEQFTSSIDAPQDFSVLHSDCLQSSETHQSSYYI